MRLWRALEILRGWSGVSAVWREHLGDELTLVQPWLVPRDVLARSLPGPNGTVTRVVVHDEDDIVGIDPVTGRVLPAKRDDLVVYDIDLGTIARAAGGALEFRGEIERLEHHLWRLGEFVPMEGERFPVFMVIAHEAPQLLSIASRASSMAGRPFILITPTRRHVCDRCHRLLRDRQSILVTLEETMRFGAPGLLSLRQPTRNVLRAFIEQHASAAINATPDPRFPTPAGTRWCDVSMRFTDGHTVSVSASGVTKRCTYEDMGMAKKRSKQPTIQWELLRAFATEHGILSWSNLSATRQNQKRRERLADDLQAYFGIADDPFEYDSSLGGWRARFTIEPD